jgi:hypothetical protein
MTDINLQDIEAAMERGCQRALNTTFLHLGVDLANDKEREALKEQFEFLKRMNRGAQEVKRATIKTCVGALITGLIALVLIGVRQWFQTPIQPS